MTYMLWQFDIKAPLSKSVQQALDYHEKKYGKVPNLIEHGGNLELPPIEGVQYKAVSIPSNILLLAVE